MPNREKTFNRDEILHSWWPNAVGAFLSTQSARLVVSIASPTTVQVVAGAGDGLVACAVSGRMRWIEATVSRAHPGGAAGPYDVFVTAADNDVDPTPLPGTDNTVRAFALDIKLPPATPTINPGVVDVFRKVGSLEWSGTAVTAITQTEPAAPSPLPAGSIVAFGGAAAPAGWLLCDGSVVSRTTFAALFAAVGTAHNTGGEAGTDFRLPNLKGRVPVGRDAAQTEFDVLGESGGAKTHTLTTPEMPAHNHQFLGSAPGIGGGAISGALAGVGSLGAFGMTNTGGGGAHNNLQPYAVVNYVIRT